MPGSEGSFFGGGGGGGTPTPTPATSVAILAHVLPTGTQGGDFVSGSRQTRPINTVVSDTDGIVSLSGNQFTLQAGNYSVQAAMTAFEVGRNVAFLRNVTDSQDVDQSLNNESNSTFNAPATINASFSIASAKVFEIQHVCETTQFASGFGRSGNFAGIEETYLNILVRKL